MKQVYSSLATYGYIKRILQSVSDYRCADAQCAAWLRGGVSEIHSSKPVNCGAGPHVRFNKME